MKYFTKDVPVHPQRADGVVGVAGAALGDRQYRPLAVVRRAFRACYPRSNATTGSRLAANASPDAYELQPYTISAKLSTAIAGCVSNPTNISDI
jgi:hypothetical protein